MYSKQPETPMHSAAWRISLWSALAFALGTIMLFVMLHSFMADDIQRRSDAWLSGEVEVLSDVAERTPKDRLYSRVVSEVAELASKEVPNRLRPTSGDSADQQVNDSVFFLQTSASGAPQLWVGLGSEDSYLHAIHAVQFVDETPSDIRVAGFATPYRVARARLDDGSFIYLGLSERDELRVLRKLRVRFLVIWLAVVLIGFGIVFYVTRRMLGDVRRITEAASTIGESDLRRRVPVNDRRDEAAHLALTLNHMLDRIESSVHQLHTITDALAHDLRSPLTAIRGKLEVALSSDIRLDQAEPIVASIDELDRLTEFLTAMLDVAEANANALRLTPVDVDLDQLIRSMINLYEPSMLDRGLSVQLRSAGPEHILADAALLHRAISNLLDNELKHLPAGCQVFLTIASQGEQAVLTVEDDGPGFDPTIGDRLFEQRVKGQSSGGHGLGLAFVEAVVRAHGGTIRAANRVQGGALLELTWPLAPQAVAQAVERAL